MFQAKSYVPKALEHYVDQLAKGLQEPQWPENVDPLKLLSIGSSSAAAAASALADLEVIDGGAGRVAQSSSYIGRERTRTTSSNNNNIIIDTNNNNNNNNSN